MGDNLILNKTFTLKSRECVYVVFDVCLFEFANINVML